MVMMGLGAMALLLWLMASFTQFIDLTAVATFLLAPFLALLNHRAVFGPDVPLDQQPTAYLRLWSWIGILFLGAFALLYLWMRFLR
jgi:apolipoprotein N-acyltransferase